MEFLQSLILLLIVLATPKLRKVYLFYPTKPWHSRAPTTPIRLPFFDFARGIAIVSVILIHATYIFLLRHPNYNPFWLDVVNNLSRFAVGFFFIASGALLTSGLTPKKLLRVFLPYVLFCLAVGLFEKRSWYLIIGGVARGDLLPQLYFIPVLFQFYLLFPLLAKFRHKKYFLAASLFFSYLGYAVPGLTYILGVPTFLPFLFLFTFGMAYSEPLKRKKPSLFIAYCLLIIFLYIVLQFMLPARYYNSRFFYAPALFVVLHYAWTKTNYLKKAKFLQTLGRLSLWIYLVHFSIESFFVNLLPFNFGYSVFLYIFLITILTVVVSGVVSSAISKLYLKISSFRLLY